MTIPTQTETPSETADKSAHTPGPWETTRRQGKYTAVYLLRDSSNQVIAEIAPFGTVHAEISQANARLIAAAPETAAERDKLREQVKVLLAACKFLFGAIESGELVRDISRDGDPNWTRRMFDFTVGLTKVQAAIANAEGK